MTLPALPGLWAMALDSQARPLRADAERNRRRLLDAAATVFAEHGLDASVSEIARRAGVGQGTVFRRFPSKERLIAAIIVDRLSELTAVGEAQLEADKPADGLQALLRAGAELQANDRGFFEGIAGVGLEDEEVRAQHHALIEITRRLVTRAQDAGEIRDDVSAEDVLLLQGAICQGAAPLLEVDPELWRRYFDLVFDALRRDGAHPLSHPAPTPEQFEAAFDAKVRAGRKAS
jgi:AcrR family transcriptional regulator